MRGKGLLIGSLLLWAISGHSVFAQQSYAVDPSKLSWLPEHFASIEKPKINYSTRAAEWDILIDHAPDWNVFGGLFLFALNSNFGCQYFLNYDEGNYSNTPDTVDFTIGYAEWVINTLVNADSGIVYPFDLNTACISYHIDSLVIPFTYSNPANLNDTLIVELWLDNTMLWADTVIDLFTVVPPEVDDLRDTIGLMTINVNLSLDTPPGIVRFRFKYFAQKDSAAFGFITGLKPNTCNNQCFVSDTDVDFPGNFNYYFKYQPVPSLCNQLFTNNPASNVIGADCDQNGSIEGSTCELFLPEPLVWAYGKIRTTNYPIFLDADIQTVDNTRLVCAGQDVNVEATTGFDSYTWSGTGASGTTNIGTINIPPASVTSNPDTFIITVTGQGSAIGCSASDQLTVVAYNAPPIANFVLNTTPGDPTITVDNTSLWGVSCIWNWGDGNLSTACEPFAYTYGSLGEYTITLIVSNPCGSDTIQRTAVLTSNQLVSSATLTYMHRNNTVIIDGLTSEATHIAFTDVMGRTVKIIPTEGKDIVEVKLDDMPAQVYNVIILGKEGKIGMFRFTK